MPKTMDDVTKTVLNYGSHEHNKWLTDPQGDEDAEVAPRLSTMGANDFSLFFIDFTHYIRVENDMPNVVMTASGLKKCRYWADLIGYVFNLQ